MPGSWGGLLPPFERQALHVRQLAAESFQSAHIDKMRLQRDPFVFAGMKMDLKQHNAL
jgi:hypothetical protein